MYGLTESFRSTYLPPALFGEKKGAIGRAIPNVEVFVVDPEKGLCQPGEPGELLHRGSLISMGYFGRPVETANRIKPNSHLQQLIGEEKVVHSGDLVRMDDDGILWFVSRLDSMIKSSGFRISPTEVEDVVFECSFVEDVVAFGIDDERLGQFVAIVVSRKPGASLSQDELRDYCQGNMPSYMVPRRIEFWEGRMPRTSSGKIDRPSVIREVHRRLDT